MAKGLRSSVKKTNRTKLRSRVFEPMENARLERLHAKLLEAAQQPKPETPKKNEMEVDTAEGNSRHRCQPTLTQNADLSPLADTAPDASKEDEFPKGLSILTASIPPSLSTNAAPGYLDPTTDARASEHLYHLLGLSSDVVGFTSDGDLAFAFDPLPRHWLSSDQGLTVAS